MVCEKERGVMFLIQLNRVELYVREKREMFLDSMGFSLKTVLCDAWIHVYREKEKEEGGQEWGDRGRNRVR